MHALKAVGGMPSAVSCNDYKVNVLIEVRQQRIRNQIAFHPDT